eukprot:m51a1_g5133 putative protein kinase domain containing protein (73) ;mRNA; f:8-226
MVMYEVMTRHNPFNGIPVMSLVPHIITGQRPPIPENTKGYNSAYVALMQRTWNKQADERPGFSAISAALSDC